MPGRSGLRRGCVRSVHLQELENPAVTLVADPQVPCLNAASGQVDAGPSRPAPLGALTEDQGTTTEGGLPTKKLAAPDPLSGAAKELTRRAAPQGTRSEEGGSASGGPAH